MDANAELTPESQCFHSIALDFPANESDAEPSQSISPAKLPLRLRSRLLETKATSTTAQDIEAKLRDARLRRQQFHELLIMKARPKMKSSERSFSQEEDLSQRLEAKLNAAQQKRLSIIANVQKRLVRLDELRQAAKSSAKTRFEKEREELSIKVASRVQQAEENRMLLLKASRQRRALKREKMTESVMRRLIQESKYKEYVQTAIHRKRAAAEKKRKGLLDSERSRAHARALRVRRIARMVCSQREIERMRMKNQLEGRLQRAKRLRLEYLKQRSTVYSSSHSCSKIVGQGDNLARKLLRCWKRFAREKGTTLSLTKAFAALQINAKVAKEMPFENLAMKIESAVTIKAAKALLDRLEKHIKIRQEIAGSSVMSALENIDYLIKHIASPVNRVYSSRANLSSEAKKVGCKRKLSSGPVKLSRYPARVLLCAYMILGHPDLVFTERGENEIALAEAAETCIREFELLIKIILEGPLQCPSMENDTSAPFPRTFKIQLETFDKSWCSYLYHFVTWKVRDASVLVEDLVRASCQLEHSLMDICTRKTEDGSADLTDDIKSFREKAMENQKILRAKIQQLSGNVGLEHLELALSDTCEKFSHYMMHGRPQTHISSSSSLKSLSESSASGGYNEVAEYQTKDAQAFCSLFGIVSSSTCNVVGSEVPTRTTDSCLDKESALLMENEVLVNETVHQRHGEFVDALDISTENELHVQAKIKETIERAFWDGIMESMRRDEPDYGWVVKLMKEVQDELCQLSPSSWRKEIVETIDVDYFSQLLSSGALDMDYLGRILDFALVTLEKLSAPAKENELKASHQQLLNELIDSSKSGDKSCALVAFLMVKGLRFVLQEIQTLKNDISKARIRMLQPLIKGPAGLEYLKSAFENRYGSPSEAVTSLPLVKQWLSQVMVNSLQDWNEYQDSASAQKLDNVLCSQGLPPTTLKSGGSSLSASTGGAIFSSILGASLPECKGEKVDLLLRLGLLNLVTEIEGLTVETLPETLKLNFSRLRSVQSQLQKIIVICTSILVLRQTLLSERQLTSFADMENIISKCVERLYELLDNAAEDVGIPEIVEAVDEFTGCNDPEKRQARKEVISNILMKSLGAGNAVFTRVSRAVYVATRGILLGGSGVQGKQLAEMELKRVGAALLLDKLIEAVEELINMATVSANVHREWYEQILKNLH